LNSEEPLKHLITQLLNSQEPKMITPDLWSRPKLSKEISTDNLLRSQICREMPKEKIIETENCKLSFSRGKPDTGTLKTNSWSLEKNKITSGLAIIMFWKEIKISKQNLTPFNPTALFSAVKTKT
jgi:hypothetical protein